MIHFLFLLKIIKIDRIIHDEFFTALNQSNSLYTRLPCKNQTVYSIADEF